MEWLLIFALGFWVWLQSRRLDAMTRQLRELEARIGSARAAPAAAPEPLPELLLETPAPANDEPEPLLLDTPLPDVGNDAYGNAPPSQPTAATVRPFRGAPSRKTTNERGFEQWLAENGLAWIGGGVLAFGGAFLVGFAAQAGLFTPAMRLIAAVVLGFVLIGAGEWVRRAALRSEAGHALVGALLAGAGAATLYVTAWAAYGLYHYIDVLAASALLALCALLLIALSNLHGQALGVLAIAAALLAPALTDLNAWPSAALTLFVCAVGASGFALGVLRRWAWAAAMALLGLYVWFAVCVAADEIWRALAILTIASLGAAAAAVRKPLPDEAEATLSWRQAHALLPSAAICISSVFVLWTWLSTAPDASASPLGPALVAIVHAALAAFAVRRRAAQPATFAVATGALVVGLMLYSRARVYFAPGDDELYLWPFIAAGGVASSALGARPHRRGRALVAGAGALGAALLVMLAVFSRPVWAAPAVWAPLFVGALLLLCAAALAAREAREPRANWPVDLWVGAGALLALTGMESLAPTIARPAALAALSLGFAALMAWRGWRGAGYAALAAAALALTHGAAPDLAGATISGDLPIWRTLLFLAAAAGFLFGASDIAQRRAGARSIGEALSSTAILTILLALFLMLRWIAVGGFTTPLDPFTENALRALMLMGAGYIALPRGDEPGQIARVRGHVFLASGLAIALFSGALVFNPWWGEAPALVAGAPLLNAQALAFAAPGALALATSRRLYANNLYAARAYACAGAALALIWAVMEIRRAFHGGGMVAAEVGLLEGDCYGLLALGCALGVAAFARLRAVAHDEGPFTLDLARITSWCAFAGLGLAALSLLVTRNPWWGGHNPALSGDLVTAFAVLAQGAAATMALVLGHALSRGRTLDVARFAAAGAVAVFTLSFGHDAIRWLHHGGAMDDNTGLLLGLEGFAHALWPLALVLAGAELAARAPGRDAARPYLYDLQAIWAAAVWPALVWAALGLWLAFNPWWGAAPAFADTKLAALTGLASLLFAAWMSQIASTVPHLRFKPIFERVAAIAWVGHLFVALSLVVRWLFHGADMRATIAGSSLETWSYSALWAIFGAGIWARGARRNDSTLRWSGLGLLLFVTGKVIIFDTATLSGVIRAASVIGLAAVLILVALAARRFGGAQGSRE